MVVTSQPLAALAVEDTLRGLDKQGPLGLLGRVTLAVTVLILLAAVVVVRALLVTMLHQSAVAMAVLDLLGATDLPTQVAVQDTEIHRAGQEVLVVVVGFSLREAQTPEAGAAGAVALMAPAAPAL
jgi:hypothetical protein